MLRTVFLAILITLPQFTLQGLFDAIDNAIHDVGEKIDNVVEDVQSGITEVGEDIQSGISTVGQDIQSGINDVSQDISSGINEIGEEIHSGINDLDEDIHSGISNIDEHIHDAVSEIEEEVHKAEVWTETSLAELRNDLDQGARDVEQFLDDHFAELGEDVQNELDQIKGSLSEFLFQLTDIDTTFKLIRESITQNATATTYAMDLLNNTDTSAVCEACEIFIEALKTIGALSLAQDIVEEVAIDVCDDTYNRTFCKQAVDLYSDFIFDQIITKNVTNQQLCQRLSLCSNRNQDALINNYTQTILQDKLPTSYPIPTKRSTYKILHLSDPHIDLEYQEGTNAACNSPLCCRPENGNAPNASAAAQYWGTNASCDIPLRTFTQFLQFAADNLDVDMIVWTGDNIAHDFWEESQNTQTKNTYNATEDILKYFPNTTVYPMFGNHEAFPIDEYDMVGNTTSWLTSQLADMWKPWLSLDAETSFRNYSYYAEVNTVYNFKLIALDTQACDNFDLYLIEDPDDPFNQLAWLRNELYDSESKNQAVFIVGHIPTVNFFCNAAWGQRYRALIDRFTNIIRGQFFGHSHYDQISVTRSFVDNSSVGVIFVAPSMTTYSNLQPSFRIFEVDADTNVILNYHQHRLDLQKWNQNTTGPLEWDLAYDALSEYNLPNMSFQSFDNFADSIQTNITLAQAYAYNWKSGSFAIDNLAEREIENYYCFTKFSVVTDSMQCLGLQADTSDKMLLAAQLIPGGWDYSAC